MDDMKNETLSARLRREIENCGRSRYVLSRESGVSQAALCKFMHGQSLRIESVDKLLIALGLQVTKTKPTNQRKGAK